MENKSRPAAPPMFTSDDATMPPPETVSAPAPTVSVETPKSTSDRVMGGISALGNAAYKGLSYANARRARQDAN